MTKSTPHETIAAIANEASGYREALNEIVKVAAKPWPRSNRPKWDYMAGIARTALAGYPAWYVANRSELWRVGRKVPINVYKGDKPFCQCHSPEDALELVNGMNAAREAKP